MGRKVPDVIVAVTRAAPVAVTMAVIAAAAVALGGCATNMAPTDTTIGASDDSRSRAEAVFRYQSRVADALLDHYPMLDVFAEADPALRAAEARMTEVCSPLTQAVLARFEGQEPSLLLQIKVMETIDDCERAAHDTETLISSTAGSAPAPTI